MGLYQQLVADLRVKKARELAPVPSFRVGETYGHPIYLNVPYCDKDAAKGRGAKWDRIKRKWFVPAGVDLTFFKKWL